MSTLQEDPGPSNPLWDQLVTIIHEENPTHIQLDVIAFLLSQTNRKEHGGTRTRPSTLKCFTDKWSTFTTTSTIFLDTEKNVLLETVNERSEAQTTCRGRSSSPDTQIIHRSGATSSNVNFITAPGFFLSTRGSKADVIQPVRPQFIQKVVK